MTEEFVAELKRVSGKENILFKMTPLFTTNMTPYGTVQLRRERRLDLTGPPSPPEV